MELSSDAFEDGGVIPSKYTCDGKDVSPPLSISEVGAAKSLALIVDDPDAPGGVFVHWLIWNIPADVDLIPEGVPSGKSVDELGGAKQGRNDFGQIGYGGPCPPSGSTHKYRFKLYALDDVLDLDPGASKDELGRAMEGHVVTRADLIGNYKR